MLRLLLMVSVMLALVACGGGQNTKSPAPVESRTQQPASSNANAAASEQTRTYAYRAPQPSVRTVAPQPSLPKLPLAADHLRKRAKAQQQAGDYTAAAASLERGLRIAPHNAVLWHALAQLRAQQKRYAEVEQLAAKSNALAGNQSSLQSDNWQLIVQARTAQGDHTGAADARQQLQQWQ